MSVWMVRKTGSNNNGGTSQSVLATGTDGVTAGTNTLTAASNPFTLGMVGQGIAINVNGGGFVWRLITGFNNAGSIIFSGATIAAHSGQTYNVGGSWLTVNQALVTTNSVAAGDSIYLGANTYRETVAVAVSGASTATGANGVTSNGGQTFTDTTANAFTSGMVGQNIEIVAGGSSYLCKITAFSSSSVVTIAPATAIGFPTIGLSGCTWIVGKIAVIGDVDGAVTSDAGQVTLSAFTTNDTTAPSATVLLNQGTASYLAYSHITYIGGGARITQNTAAGVYYSFLDCTFNYLFGGTTVIGGFTSATTGIALGVTVDRCVMVGGVNASGGITFSLATTASGSADWDALCVVRNCLIEVVTGGALGGVVILATGTAAHAGGGVRVYDCTILSPSAGVDTATATHLSTTIPCEVHNSFICVGGTGLTAATSGQLIEDHNTILAPTARTNVTAGTGSVVNTNAPLMELGQSSKWAAGTIRQMFAPDGPGSPLLGFGAGSVAVGADWFGRPRPSGGTSASNAVGAFELHDYGVQDTVTVPSGMTSSAKLIGPGDQERPIPVDAVSSTISVQINQGSGYGGTNYVQVILEAQGELGVTTQVLTCSSTLNAWQTLTFSAITPSKKGFVKVRVVSFDTSGTGQVNFGAWTVT